MGVHRKRRRGQRDRPGAADTPAKATVEAAKITRDGTIRAANRGVVVALIAALGAIAIADINGKFAVEAARLQINASPAPQSSEPGMDGAWGLLQRRVDGDEITGAVTLSQQQSLQHQQWMSVFNQIR
jgi:predicted membrane-bound mannosyltransferase